MNNIDKIDIQDDNLKSLLKSTKIEASDNLRFRIMHQIEAEQSLVRKKVKKESSVWSNFFVFAIMYLIIIAVGVVVYLADGKGALNTSVFLMPALFISAICGTFFLISTFDDRRQNKKQKFNP